VGDPLQSIFGFGHNQLVDWDSEIMASFKKVGDLDTPWRWANTNPELGQWLKVARKKLIAKEAIDLKNVPKAITWIQSSDIVEQRKSSYKIGNRGNETSCIIRGGWEAQCHILARSTGGFFNSMETIECKDLVMWASQLEASRRVQRVKIVCDFASVCCSGVKTPFKDISKRLSDKTKRTGAIPKDVFALLEIVANEKSMVVILPALEAIRSTDIFYLVGELISCFDL
jgi:hypothetical protein